MMLRLPTKKIVLITILWESLFVLLVLTGWNHLQLLNIIGFLTLGFLPGTLTLILMRLPKLPSWASIALAVGFSLLELMLVGLIGNTLLPHVGIARPLDKPYLLIEFVLLINSLLIGVVATAKEELRISIYPLIFFRNKRDAFFALFPILFVILGIFGAFRLNNGTTGTLTMWMLAGVGIFIAFLIYNAKRVGENVIPTALFFLTLSLLLMTSLRGWYVTGHDIQREYKVFQLAQDNGLWSMANYQDPYNACLSITILPTWFANILSLPSQYVFKFLFQLFFALTPLTVYFIGKEWAGKRIAIISVVYFIAFPTFFTDMPFLIRQEIAFLFYGLMLYVVFEKSLDLYRRRLLFILLGIGVIFSHYSTTYVVLIILGIALLLKPFVSKLLLSIKSKKIFTNSALLASNISKKTNITLGMVAILLVLSFTWTTLITKTGNSVAGVFSQTYSAVVGGFGGSDRSSDATSAISFAKPDPAQLMQAYIKTTIDPIREANASIYFPESTYRQYQTPGLPEERMSITGLGSFFKSQLHIDVSNILTIFGKYFAKLVEALIPLGLLYILLRKRIVSSIDYEIFLIAVFSTVFMALTVLLPVLSVVYGILRALQQSMFIIAPIMAIGSIGIWRGILWITGQHKKSNSQRSNIIFASAFALLFFFHFTGFIPQLFGKNIAVLHLSNKGTYYDDFYVHAEELYGANWLANLPPDIARQVQYDVESDRFSATKLLSISAIDHYNDIYPSIVRRNSYLFLSYANVTKERATELYTGNRITYHYPLEFLDNNKNLIYNNGGSRVYR